MLKSKATKSPKKGHKPSKMKSSTSNSSMAHDKGNLNKSDQKAAVLISQNIQSGPPSNALKDSAVAQTRLFWAVYYGLLEQATLAIKSGAEVNRVCGDKFSIQHAHTLLYIACYQGHSAIVRLLLGNNADVNQAIDDGSTPLFVACQQNKIDIVRILLDHDALVNIFDNDGESPLFVAAGVGAVKIVSMLIENGADVNGKNNNVRGATPLFIACQQGHMTTVNVLLSMGAESSKTRNDGISPLQIANQYKHHNIVELLESRVASPKINKKIEVKQGLASVSAPSWKALPQSLPFFPLQPMLSARDINNSLNTFFNIADKTKGRIVWSNPDSSSDTWTLDGLLIPLTGKKYFSKKLTALSLQEGTDFSFKEKSKTHVILSISNIKHHALASLFEKHELVEELAGGRSLLSESVS